MLQEGGKVMSEKKCIVLHSQSPIVPSTGHLGAMSSARSLGTGIETLKIEEAVLSKSERNDLRRDPRTRAIAEPMPMKLIEPTESENVADVAAENETWGVKAVRAPESPFTGKGITVAVLDTGIDPDHDAFQGVNLVRKNFTTESDDDLHGHGTHCAGTVFGKDVNGQRIGVASNIERALIGKVLGQGDGTSATIANAIMWAVENGAHVISMSLGIDFPGFVDILVHEEGLDINPATSIALEQYRANVNMFSELADFVQARGSFAQGAVIIAASGNESKRPTYEIAVGPPAAGTGIIAVGALQEGVNGFSVASFSNNQVDISAPGVGVISALRGGGLTSMNGTSMATPHVAGVATLWAQKLLDETGRVDNQILTAQIIVSGDTAPLIAGSEAEDVGAGIVQAPLS